MKTKAQLQADIDSLDAAISAIFDKADAEKRTATKEELADIEAKTASIATAKEELSHIERAEQARLAHQQRQAAKPTRKTTPDEPDGGSKITRQHENFEDDPKKGFKDHREFFTLIMSSGQRGQTNDPRLKFLSTDRFMSAGSDEQGAYADAYGKFLIPVGFMPGVMKVMAEADPLAALVKRIPMETPTLPINARVDKNHSSSVSGGFVVYRRAETQAVTSSRQTYEQVVLNANSLMGLAYATEEVISRSPISFITLIEDGMRDEFPAKLMRERISGTGVGQFEGFLNSPALISITAETGQAATTVVYENIIKMSARCWGYGNSVWLANHTCRTQLRSLTLAVGTGGVVVPLFTNDGGVERLDGRPIFFTEFCPTLGTVGDLILVNPSQYLEGTLTPLQSAESMHVRFEAHERTFKFWMENDARCWWRTALTPANGSTLSPIVALATRS